jgi:uncharacterized DUF497 family protein
MANGAAAFDWDDGNREKCCKHGVSIADIEAMLLRPFAVFPDPQHSRTVERFKSIGTTEQGRYILVVFTLRTRPGVLLIRPISARYMRRKGVEYYEKEIAKAPER